MATRPSALDRVEKARKKKAKQGLPIGKMISKLARVTGKPVVVTGAGMNGIEQPMMPAQQAPINGQMSQLHEGESVIGNNVVPAQQTLNNPNFTGLRREAMGANQGAMPSYAFGTIEDTTATTTTTATATTPPPSYNPNPGSGAVSLGSPTGTPSATTAPDGVIDSKIASYEKASEVRTTPEVTPTPTPNPEPAPNSTNTYGADYDPYTDLDQYAQGSHENFNRIEQQTFNDMNQTQRQNIYYGLSRYGGEDVTGGERNALGYQLISNANSANAEALGEIGKGVNDKMYNANLQNIGARSEARVLANDAKDAVDNYVVSMLNSSALVGLTEAEKMAIIESDPEYLRLTGEADYYTSVGLGREYEGGSASSTVNSALGNSLDESNSNLDNSLTKISDRGGTLDDALDDKIVLSEAAYALGMVSAYNEDGTIKQEVIDKITNEFEFLDKDAISVGVDEVVDELYRDEIDEMTDGMGLSEEQDKYLREWVRKRLQSEEMVIENGVITTMPTGGMVWDDTSTKYDQGWSTVDDMTIVNGEDGERYVVDANGDKILFDNYQIPGTDGMTMGEFNTSFNQLTQSEQEYYMTDGSFDMDKFEEFKKYTVEYDPADPNDENNPFYNNGVLIIGNEQVDQFTNGDEVGSVIWGDVSGEATAVDSAYMVTHSAGGFLTQDALDGLREDLPEDEADLAMGNSFIYFDANGDAHRIQRGGEDDKRLNEIWYQVSMMTNDGEPLSRQAFQTALQNGDIVVDENGKVSWTVDATRTSGADGVANLGDSSSNVGEVIPSLANYDWTGNGLAGASGIAGAINAEDAKAANEEALKSVQDGIDSGLITPEPASEIPQIQNRVDWNDDSGKRRWDIHQDAIDWVEENKGTVVTIDGREYIVRGTYQQADYNNSNDHSYIHLIDVNTGDVKRWNNDDGFAS